MFGSQCRSASIWLNMNRGAGAPLESEDAVIEDFVRTVRTPHHRADHRSMNLTAPRIASRAFFSATARVARSLEVLRDMLARRTRPSKARRSTAF